MDINYLPLLKIQLQHDYYADGNCPAVKLVPSPITARIMQQMDIRSVERYRPKRSYPDGCGATP